MPTPRIRVVLVAALLAPLAACTSSRPVTAQVPEPLMGDAAAVARARADSLRYPYTKADIEFMQGMIHHHAQALVMSSWARANGASAELIRLTERIINAQNDDIVLMQMWPASFSLARAYLDQLERNGCLSSARIEEVRRSLRDAEFSSGTTRTTRLTRLVGELEGDKATSCDAPKVEMLRQATQDLVSNVVS